MVLTKQKLGEFIERVERRNSDLYYGIDSVRGISNTKEIQPTKADVSDRSFARFQIVEEKEFVFNRRTTRMGEKIGLGYNNNGDTFIVTEDYVVFRVVDEATLLPDYLNIFFRRPEFDRYSRWDSWGSATEFFNWEEMCDVPIYIPPLPIQKKYAEVYKAMLANQQVYELGLEDLKLTCDAYIERLRHELKQVEIGGLITPIDERNKDNDISDFYGINKSKDFMPTAANTENINPRNYKIVRKNRFVFSGMQTGRDQCIRISLYSGEEPVIVSPAYTTFEITSDEILSEYFFMLFRRKEMDRLGWFLSDSSVRSNLDWNRFCEITIGIPPIKVQQYIVNIHTVYQLRREINEQLKAQIRDLCPILIKGSLEEAARV
ncbi:restriction endonuclease subunit S [Oscillospiraceae bacterium OttesenSCG-928-G22]|nr:restriction endonuclease subunit S [Oscillospiraceae bacterium OttesenSCG-928-G22]